MADVCRCGYPKTSHDLGGRCPQTPGHWYHRSDFLSGSTRHLRAVPDLPTEAHHGAIRACLVHGHLKPCPDCTTEQTGT